MKHLEPILSAVLIAALSIAQANAADFQVKMLDNSKEGSMAYEPNFIKAGVGDTIVFVPANKGHDSSSLLVPTGANPWKGTFDKEIRVKLEKEGVYLFACDAHKSMGMVGVIQVGKAVNLAEAKKKAEDENAKIFLNKDRFSKALAQVR
jgi:pseudoazurin